MPLKIIPADQPILVTRIITLLLGLPKIGKTSLANTSEVPLLLDFDGGSHRSLGRQDVVRIHTWADVDSMDANDLKPYRTIIVDTVGRCLECMALDIMQKQPKMSHGGQLTLPGYGRLKSRFTTWMKELQSYGLNIVLIAHALEEKQGDDVKLRVDAMGSSREEVYKLSDLMGRVFMQDGKRVVDWDPSDSGFGNNPAGLPFSIIPPPSEQPDFLARCIRTTIDHLSQANAEATAEEVRLRELTTYIEGLDTPTALTELAKNMVATGANKADRAILVRVGLAKGYEFNPEARTFTDPNAPKEEETPQGEEGEQEGLAF